ncbi:uncharacterized protein L201_005472 [Kwoniella dendrophila CBS 6074]|uniref:Uncharacterized protein n=1 Tax=Kwoniella dendrophila CBS 6074 TaxID=1295534 RepID=A0AAX4JYH3_9TREE
MTMTSGAVIERRDARMLKFDIKFESGTGYHQGGDWETFKPQLSAKTETLPLQWVEDQIGKDYAPVQFYFYTYQEAQNEIFHCLVTPLKLQKDDKTRNYKLSKHNDKFGYFSKFHSAIHKEARLDCWKIDNGGTVDKKVLSPSFSSDGLPLNS